MSVRLKSRACSAAWASPSFPRRKASSAAARPRNKTSAENCSPSFGNHELAMSRIGKKVIELPAKVKLNITGEGAVSAEGPKGKLAWTLPKNITGRVDGNNVHIERTS